MSKNSENQASRYPLLEALLKEKGLALKGIYKYTDAAEIFGASVRTIQQYVRDGKLRCRDLPGRGRFLSEDLEAFLHNSERKKATITTIREGNDARFPHISPRSVKDCPVLLDCARSCRAMHILYAFLGIRCALHIYDKHI